MSTADRRRSARTAPPGASAVTLVHGKLSVGGRLIDVSSCGARVRLDEETPSSTVSGLQRAAEEGTILYLVDERAHPYRRVRVVWIGSVSEGGFALGLETAPDEPAAFETGPDPAPYLPIELVLPRHARSPG